MIKKFGLPLSSSLNFSSAYSFNNLDNLKDYYNFKYSKVRYGRDANSLSLELEDECKTHYDKNYCLSFGSGMSAVSAAIFSKIQNDTIIITFGNFYRKSRAIIEELSNKFKIKNVNFLRYKNFLNWAKKNQKKSKKIIFFLEIPSNPFLKIIDIKNIRKNFVNSFIITDLSFTGFKNDKNILSLSDIVIFSLTKYINGHNDSLGGLLVIKEKKVFEKVWNYRSTFGGIIDPMSAYLILRSLKTFDMRNEKMIANTIDILAMLGKSKNILKIWYPGKFENKNQIKRFENYMINGGSVITFETKKLNSINVMHKLKTIKMAPSFGSIDTLIEWPYFMSYFNQPKKILRKLNIKKNLVRISVGCENINLLSKDIKKIISH